MKSILISIHSQWVEKILNGEKTIEIRKTMPKGKLPCKVYIYCTNGDILHDLNNEDYLKPLKKRFVLNPNIKSNKTLSCSIPMVNRKVVAEFTLNKVECFTTDYRRDKKQLDRIIKDSCVDFETLEKYEYGKPFLYAWHIDDLKIYNKPKDLSEFESPKIDLSKEYGGSTVCPAYSRKKITRAPQNWCYIEEGK